MKKRRRPVPVERCPASAITIAWAIEARAIATDAPRASSPTSLTMRCVRTMTVMFVRNHSPLIRANTCQNWPAYRPASTCASRGAPVVLAGCRRKIGASATCRV